MSWTNYHSHTKFCDGTHDPESYIRSALTRKMPAYGFSGHAPLPFETSWSMNSADLKSYLDEIVRLKDLYKDTIEIYTGLEIDFMPGHTNPINKKSKELNLDYTIGSVHYAGIFNNGQYWCIDSTEEEFINGVDAIFGGKIEPAVKQYFKVLRDMIKNDCPDIIGHFDKIKLPLIKYFSFDESTGWYKKEIAETLELIANSDAIVEINTRGLYKHGINNVYPGKWIVKSMAEMKIPIVLNSDAHKPDEVDSGFPSVARMLHFAGYDTLFSFIGGEWQEFEFDPNGLKI